MIDSSLTHSDTVIEASHLGHGLRGHFSNLESLIDDFTVELAIAEIRNSKAGISSYRMYFPQNYLQYIHVTAAGSFWFTVIKRGISKRYL